MSASSRLSIRRSSTLTALSTTCKHEHCLRGCANTLTKEAAYSSVDVLEARGDTLADVLDLALLGGGVHGKGVEDEDLAPLRALVQGCQQLGDRGGVEIKESGAGVEVVDLRQRSNSIGHHHGVGIRQELLQRLDESLLRAKS